jgi:hypothetical protein
MRSFCGPQWGEQTSFAIDVFRFRARLRTAHPIQMRSSLVPRPASLSMTAASASTSSVVDQYVGVGELEP